MVRLKEKQYVQIYRYIKFQFQYGTIKRDIVLGDIIEFSYFNSSMVRLKAL